MSDETFNNVYAQQDARANAAATEGDGTSVDGQDPDDSAEKLLEQNDQRYV